VTLIRQAKCAVNERDSRRFQKPWNFFRRPAFIIISEGSVIRELGILMRDKTNMNQMTPARPRRSEDGLGPNSDIGAKLRALYGQVQDEGIPDKFLDLLEKLAAAEEKTNVTAKSE
jgi:hypothetical protein